MKAFYNEIDPFAAQWLRELISAGHIAPGDVSEKDIRDVTPAELARYDECHFFAGIGVWSHALRRAGWPAGRKVWTGSPPCQPFSAVGRRGGTSDERHLWPHFFHLIEQCRPPVLFGEQVASPDGLGWLDLVSDDMEGADYAFGAFDLCAAGFGAPQIRQRLYFAGVDNGQRAGLERFAGHGAREAGRALEDRSTAEAGPFSGLADAAHGSGQRQVSWPAERLLPEGARAVFSPSGDPRPVNGFWRSSDWLFCRDGGWRPVEPGTFPLAYGAPARVGRLRGFGNAIVAEQATGFIESYLEAEPEFLAAA